MSQYLNIRGIELLQASLGPVGVVFEKGRLVINQDVYLDSLGSSGFDYSIEPVLLVLLVERTNHLKLRRNPPPCNEYFLFRLKHGQCHFSVVVLPVYVKLNVTVLSNRRKRIVPVQGRILRTLQPLFYVIDELQKTKVV